ncbi:hypothetical protein BTA51_15645 [Hahella sp. CCB-MM4]|uniref:hypothetical protein n=1 Tax=Hahella sp. (strain CCB-MM4) TaxID=1926491 RepID=UPI000B9C1583|nr:hypothetical protein [Hahella sp. CCB-MM4]OZG72549.1 hypothetical protein BTA51_15645 [Hahella sp. CCB-MM4]
MKNSGQLLEISLVSRSEKPSDHLSRILMFDGALSLLLAVDLMLFSDLVAGLMGSVQANIYFALGVALAIWSVDLFLLAANERFRSRFTHLTVWADWIWVAATLAVIMAFNDLWTGFGIATLTAIGVLVAGIALMKTRALQQLAGNDG